MPRICSEDVCIGFVPRIVLGICTQDRFRGFVSGCAQDTKICALDMFRGYEDVPWICSRICFEDMCPGLFRGYVPRI